jgi:hypothetical protein
MCLAHNASMYHIVCDSASLGAPGFFLPASGSSPSELLPGSVCFAFHPKKKRCPRARLFTQQCAKLGTWYRFRHISLQFKVFFSIPYLLCTICKITTNSGPGSIAVAGGCTSGLTVGRAVSDVTC